MAIDEALLRTRHRAGPALLWLAPPALSFGYFGKFADVAAEMEQRDIVRRWTGGGIVPHGEDLTYSLVTPSSRSRVFARTECRLCRAPRRHSRRAERRRDRSGVGGSSHQPKISDACFANPVRNDVMLSGRKIAGAAQRRTRRGFLHQGSIQIPNLPESFRAGFVSRLAAQIEWVKVPPTIHRAGH